MSEKSNESVAIEKVQLGELACWRIITPYATALVAEQGAQVLEYRPMDGDPVIWLSEKADFRTGESVRGGAPVCWPWFGDLGSNPESVRDCVGQSDGPKHGWVRAIPWELSESQGEDGAATLVFTLDTRHAGLPWRHHAVIVLSVHVGKDALTLSLSTRNDGPEPLYLTQALHGYFAVSDARAVTLTGFAGKRYIDTVGGWTEKRQSGDISITAETDRIYLDPSPVLTIDDPQWNRRIVIEPRHSASCVVWNPWIDKAARLSGFAADAWQRMVCVETARVLDDLMVVPPGQTAEAGVRISSVSLSGARRSAGAATTDEALG